MIAETVVETATVETAVARFETEEFGSALGLRNLRIWDYFVYPRLAVKTKAVADMHVALLVALETAAE